MFAKLRSLFVKPVVGEFTDEDLRRGYTLKVKRVVGELVQGWVTVIFEKVSLPDKATADIHTCLPIPDSLRKNFQNIFHGVPSEREKYLAFDYLVQYQIDKWKQTGPL